MTDALLLDRDTRGVATLTLNRPDRHNAFDDALIAEITGALTELAHDPGLRALVLAASGRSFSAGADVAWMRRMAGYTEAENVADASAMARMMHLLDRFPCPTIARVQGAALGGGVGLAACCDMVVAATGASFCLSEVRLGLIPAVISPYVIQAIGARQARRWFVTAETFDAATARAIGLVNEVVPPDQLDGAVERLVGALLDGAPGAQRDAKSLVFLCEAAPSDAALSAETSRRIAARRASDEGRAGLSAFLAKTKPEWQRRR